MSSRSRRGPTSSQGGSSSSTSSVRRSARLASFPGEDHVQRRREGEQTRGCPPAPHNSVDQSVIVLDETLQEIQEVFQEGGEATAVPTEGRPVPINVEEEFIVIGDDTVEEQEDISDTDIYL